MASKSTGAGKKAPSAAIPIVAPTTSSATTSTTTSASATSTTTSASAAKGDNSGKSGEKPVGESSSAQGSPTPANYQPPMRMTSQSAYPQYQSSSTATGGHVQIDPAFEQSELLGLDFTGVRLRSLPAGLFAPKAFESLFELRVGGNLLTRLPPQIQQFRNLVVLDASDNQLTSVPKELGRLVNLQELLLHNNQLTTLPAELGYLYQLEVLALEGNPLQEPLLSLCHSQGPLSVITYLREHVLSINPPPDRVWHTLETVPAGTGTFTVMSYNVLAEKYATQQMYGYVASWYLSWDVRKQMVLHEILTYDADIVCLQEVEAGQFEQYFKPQLRMRGNYDGVFAPKSRARTMNDWDRAFVDGCATFFKMDRFRLAEQHVIEFNQLALARPLLRRHKDMYNRVMTRDNIALAARLQMLLGPAQWQDLVVCNVHIHWDPSFRDVKLVQAIMLCEELERICQAASAQGQGMRRRPGLIVAGDFNSLPPSGVCKFLAGGGIGPRHDDFMGHTYEPYSTEGARHRLTLRSAYHHLGGASTFASASANSTTVTATSAAAASTVASDEEEHEETEEDDSAMLPFTNLTPSFQGCIDYVYYGTADGGGNGGGGGDAPLRVTGLLAGLDKSYTRQLVGLPSAHFPSDHISLLVEFALNQPGVHPATTTTASTSRSKR